MSLNLNLMKDAERHYDAFNFDDLYETAVSACLRKDPEPIIEKSGQSHEALLLRKVGSRGLGLALDIITHPHELTFTQTEDEEGEYITDSLPLRRPEVVGGQQTPEIQAKIEAFGLGLLNEAYVGLGADVGARIQQFKDAETDEEQIKVLEWLDDRIFDMKKKVRESDCGEDEMRNFYHPVRLSPKLLGQYPHHTLEPTCLSISILTSSFLYQTGADALHAGVMKIATETDKHEFAQMCMNLIQRDDIGIPPAVCERLKAKADDLLSAGSEIAFHAASVVKLKSGVWYILDPNYSASYMMTATDDSSELTKAHDQMNEFHTIAPGLERTLKVGYSSTPWVGQMIAHYMETPEIDDSTFEDILSPDDIELMQMNARVYVLEALKNIKFDRESIAKLYNKVLDEQIINQDVYSPVYNRNTTIFDEAFEQAWEGFFLYGESPDEIIKRTGIDESYKTRRIEDIQLLPYMTYLLSIRLIADLNAADKSPEHFHSMLELGLPSYRIGAAVLSDFATYCGDDLSYSFWAAHWPSKIPLTERMPEDLPPKHQLHSYLDSVFWLSNLTLKYSKQNGIVKKFCQQLGIED